MMEENKHLTIKEVNILYDEIVDLRSSLAAQAARIAELEGELAEARLNHKSSEAVIFAVIDAIGGLVEGLPTQRINFLQRVRELVRTEKELAGARREVAEKDRDIQLLGDSLNGLNDEIAALRKRCEEALSLVDGMTEVVEIWGSTPAQIAWRKRWMERAREVLKEAAREEGEVGG